MDNLISSYKNQNRAEIDRFVNRQFSLSICVDCIYISLSIYLSIYLVYLFKEKRRHIQSSIKKRREIIKDEKKFNLKYTHMIRIANKRGRKIETTKISN